jgi:hypothetical protein
LAAKQLDEMWDGQVALLNSSYQQTLALLDAGKTTEAYNAFHGSFVPAVKKIYSEAPQTYPQRFSKIDNWCDWIKGLYVGTMKADAALAKADPGARKMVDGLREQFYKLHKETGTQKINDFIYALHAASAQDNISIDDLKSLRKSLGEAGASVTTQAQADAFAKARTQYEQKLDAILEDGKVDPAEVQPLRQSTDAIYNAYGIQME